MASSNTTIEWTDRTWNPVRGCTRVSQGCTHCYAEKIAYRFSGKGQAFEGLAKKVGNEARWTGRVMLLEKELETPFKWKQPQKIFVNSVSDLFHEEVPFWFIDQVFLTMALAQQHTFQVLTKRPQRAVAYFQDVARRMQAGGGWFYPNRDSSKPSIHESGWPLENVWIGVSVEDQKAADERIPLLIQIPAAVRFLSCEPLLGPIDLARAYPCGYYCDEGAGEFGHYDHPFLTPQIKPAIDWIIVGGESGRGARQMHPDWVRELRYQCQRAGVKFFFKQWGEWLPFDQDKNALGYRKPVDPMIGDTIQGWTRVGKKAAGRELDGRTWDEMPVVEAEALA